MVGNEGDALGTAVVCPPLREYARVDDPGRHNFLERPDEGRARAQHDELRRLLAGAGVEVVRVSELEGHPNSVFVRDTALVTPRGYVRLRMGLGARRGEEAWVARHLEGLGVPCAGVVEPPGTLEGGDVFLLGGVALVGLSSRTNAEGARQLSRILEGMGCRVRTAPIAPPWLHLGSVLSPVGPDRVVFVRGSLPPDFLSGLDVIEAPSHPHRPATANVICLRPGEVVGDGAESPGTLEALERAGAAVRVLDLSEFGKGAGGPTCLVLPVRRVRR